MFVLPRLTTLLALLLAAVLMMTQTLGLVHGITHGASGSSLHSHDHHHGPSHDHAEVESATNDVFLTALFSTHQEASDCRLYDQSSHDGALVAVTPLVLPVVPPPFSVAIFQGEALARWAALFDARGPPLTV
jgi:hypothetical protein